MPAAVQHTKMPAGSPSPDERGGNKRLKGDDNGGMPRDEGMSPYGSMPPQGQRYPPSYGGPPPPPGPGPGPPMGWRPGPRHPREQYGNGHPQPPPHSWGPGGPPPPGPPGVAYSRGSPMPPDRSSGWNGGYRSPQPASGPSSPSKSRGRQRHHKEDMMRGEDDNGRGAYPGWNHGHPVPPGQPGPPQQQQQQQWQHPNNPNYGPPPGWQGGPPQQPMHQPPIYASQGTWTGGGGGGSKTPPRGRPRPEQMGGYGGHGGPRMVEVRVPEMDMYMARQQQQQLDGDGEDSSLGGDDKEKGRGSYKCGRCGVPKKGHVCPYQPKLKRRPDEPPPELRNAAIQVEMDEFMTLRRLNLKIQGFPESYATEPYAGENMVVGERHRSPASMSPETISRGAMLAGGDDSNKKPQPELHESAMGVRGSPPTPSSMGLRGSPTPSSASPKRGSPTLLNGSSPRGSPPHVQAGASPRGSPTSVHSGSSPARASPKPGPRGSPARSPRGSPTRSVQSETSNSKSPEATKARTSPRGSPTQSHKGSSPRGSPPPMNSDSSPRGSPPPMQSGSSPHGSPRGSPLSTQDASTGTGDALPADAVTKV